MDKTHIKIYKMAINKKTTESFISRNGIIFTGTPETIDAMIYQSRKITTELTKAGRYEKTDDILIESLVMCVEVQHMAFWHIKEKGVMVFVDAAEKVKQKNPSVTTIDQMTRTILNISSKLGLSALDRLNLKMEVKATDGLDD